MEPITITCELCGQPAFVLKARYKYQGDGADGRPAKEHVLTEIQRELECPHCGMRMQTVRENEQ